MFVFVVRICYLLYWYLTFLFIFYQRSFKFRMGKQCLLLLPLLLQAIQNSQIPCETCLWNLTPSASFSLVGWGCYLGWMLNVLKGNVVVIFLSFLLLVSNIRIELLSKYCVMLGWSQLASVYPLGHWKCILCFIGNNNTGGRRVPPHPSQSTHNMYVTVPCYLCMDNKHVTGFALAASGIPWKLPKL